MKEIEGNNTTTEDEKTDEGQQNEFTSPENFNVENRGLDSLEEVTEETFGEIETESSDTEEMSTLGAEQPAVGIQSESKFRKFFRNFIRWAAGLLIIFGLGLITGIYVFYRPAVEDSEIMGNKLLTEIQSTDKKNQDLESQILVLKSEISDLQPYKDENEEILAINKNLELHIAILNARLDVATALYAINLDDFAQAQVILDKTQKHFDQISLYLEDDQQEVIKDLKTRLGWILDDVGEDSETAQSDLNVIGAKLLQLEDSLLSK